MLANKLRTQLVPKLDFTVPKFDFAVVGSGHRSRWTCKQAIRATFFGTRTIFIRAVPEIFRSVNGASDSL